MIISSQTRILTNSEFGMQQETILIPLFGRSLSFHEMQKRTLDLDTDDLMIFNDPHQITMHKL